MLEKAEELSHAKNVMTIPKELFEKCKGICLISIVEVGFIFSGNVGTGIILAKNEDGSWSKPVACGLTGVGWGFLVGGSVKETMIFIMDDNSMEGMSSDKGLKIGGQLELTVGPWGRSGRFDLGLGTKGASGTVAIAMSMGAFLGVNIHGSAVGARDAVNASFYGKEVTPRQIMYGDEVSMPEGKETKINEVYEKLKNLTEAAPKTEEGDKAEAEK